MSADEQMESATRRLKQVFLRKAISEGRGPEAIAKLNRLYAHIQQTNTPSDEDIRSSFKSIAADGEGAVDITDEFSQQQLESVLRPKNVEDPEIKRLMEEDLKSQLQVVDYLRNQGIPENMLPLVSPTLAYLNALKTKQGQKTVQFDRQSFDRIEKLLTTKPPTNTIN